MSEEQLEADVFDPRLDGIASIADGCDREYGFSVRFGGSLRQPVLQKSSKLM